MNTQTITPNVSAFPSTIKKHRKADMVLQVRSNGTWCAFDGKPGMNEWQIIAYGQVVPVGVARDVFGILIPAGCRYSESVYG